MWSNMNALKLALELEDYFFFLRVTQGRDDGSLDWKGWER